MTCVSPNPCVQWTNLPDDDLSVESIQKYLVPISDDLWVAAACLDKLVDDINVQRCLLNLGIERTEDAVEQTKRVFTFSRGHKGEEYADSVGDEDSPGSLTTHFHNVPAHAQLFRIRALLLERLDRLNTFVEICKLMSVKEEEIEADEWEDDPWVDETTQIPTSTKFQPASISLPNFLVNHLFDSACFLASSQELPALQILFQHHPSSLWPFRFTILECIPEHTHPSLFGSVLPSLDPTTNTESAWIPIRWRPELDYTETPEVQAAIVTLGVGSDIPPDSCPESPSRVEPLTDRELTAWYTAWVDRIISSVGMVDIALAAIQHGASQGVPELDELGEELSLLSRLVYDTPPRPDNDLDDGWTLDRWKSMDSASVVQAFLEYSTPETIAQDISRLVLPYLFVLESRAERLGKPDTTLHYALLYDYTLKAPLEFAAEIFEASKPTLTPNERLVKNDEDIARLALACLYGSDSLDKWGTMSRIFECLPAWDVQDSDEDETDAADTTVSSLAAFVTPITTHSRCTPSDLILFFNPLPKTSLSRSLDILDVHLESGEILFRWGVPAPLHWFLQSSNNAVEQRAWANRLARRAGNSEDNLNTPDDWSLLLEDMLKLSGAGDSGLRSAFGLLSREEIIRIFFSGLLSTGKFNIAKTLLRSSASDLSLDAESIEEICLSCSQELYDNASSGNYKFGDMKLAYECLDVAPQSIRITKEKEFIEATSRLSSFNVMSRPGIPISPIEIRLTKDRLSLVSRVLSSNVDAYKHTEVILDLVRKLGFQNDKAAEVKVLAMLADTALQVEDFTRAFELTQQMVDTVLHLRSSALSVDDPTIEEVTEVCWVACFQLGRQPEFDDLEKKLTLLGRSLELCPPDKLHDILVAWRRLGKEDNEQRQEKLTHRCSGTTAASSTKKRTAPAKSSLSSRLQDFRMPSSPLLKTPDASAIASRTLRSVAANFPFSVAGRSSSRDRDGIESGRRRPDGVDVSAQASRVLSKGFGWLIGDDL